VVLVEMPGTGRGDGRRQGACGGSRRRAVDEREMGMTGGGRGWRIDESVYFCVGVPGGLFLSCSGGECFKELAGCRATPAVIGLWLYPGPCLSQTLRRISTAMYLSTMYRVCISRDYALGMMAVRQNRLQLWQCTFPTCWIPIPS
jgi:hypothetical protein